MSERILVTGSSGMLGSCLKDLTHSWTFVRKADADLTDSHATRKLFNDIKPQTLIHLAANVGGVKKNAEQNADMLAENMLMNVNTLKAAQENGVQRIVSVLSSCAFHSPSSGISTLNDLHKDLPFLGNLGYSYAKRVLDIYSRLLTDQYGISCVTITPATLFGPYDNWDLASGHVVASLIHKCALAKASGSALEVWGTGKAVRQFVWAPDIARFIFENVQKIKGPDTLIMMPNDGICIADLAQAVAEAMDFTGAIHFDATKPEGIAKRVLHDDALQKSYPNFKFTSLNEALSKTVAWFVDNSSRSGALR